MATTIEPIEVKKTMTIADILESVPDSVQVMLDAGLHCVGCHANLYETLEEGMLGHGFNNEEIDELVAKINSIGKEQAAEKKPTEEDFKTEKVREDEELFYILGGLKLTEKAYHSIHELANGKKGLQIRIDAGGCSGYSYKYDFADKPEQDEKKYTLSDNITIFMNDFSFDKLHGSVVDFQSGLQGSGLTFENPNTTGSCGCGTSVGF
jgi:iron-sulfur cluster assembly accessory protein